MILGVLEGMVCMYVKWSKATYSASEVTAQDKQEQKDYCGKKILTEVNAAKR